MTPEFIPFPKMARLSREVLITEKIDGTNATIQIIGNHNGYYDADPMVVAKGESFSAELNDMIPAVMYAGSRTRWITPQADNHGFATWVAANAQELFELGVGTHRGEWWGSGIQRGYGLTKGEKRLSLFNVMRWTLHGTEPQRIPMADPRIEKFQDVLPPCCNLVPVLYRGIFSTGIADAMLCDLAELGSKAAPGFMNPEGIVLFHIAGNVGFKKTILKDEKPKGKH
jgi:hypothetical protein